MTNKAKTDLAFLKSSDILVVPEDDWLAYTKAIIDKNDLALLRWLLEES